MKNKIRKKISGVTIHNDHIDVDIPLGILPFPIAPDEELYCRVKGLQQRGIHIDNKAHIVIAKMRGEKNEKEEKGD